MKFGNEKACRYRPELIVFSSIIGAVRELHECVV